MAVVLTHIYKVGDKVRFQLGAHKVVGTVIEDRGLIGLRGRQLVRVAVALDPPYEQHFELPAYLLEPEGGAAKLI